MREILSKGDLNAKAEVALMGLTVQILDRENMEYVLDYISKVVGNTEMTGKEIYEEATKYTNPKDTEPVGLCCCRVLGMPTVTIIFKDKGKSLKLDSPNGVLCHVHNYVDSICSELGYCFFERKGPSYHRIG